MIVKENGGSFSLLDPSIYKYGCTFLVILKWVMFGECEIAPLDKSEKYTNGNEIRWITLRRSNATNTRDARPNQFYPIYVDRETRVIKEIGDVISLEIDRKSVPEIPGCDTVFPIRDDGTEMLWGVIPDVLRDRLKKGYVKVCGFHKNKPQQYVIQYLTSGTIQELENGVYDIIGKNDDGSVIAIYKQSKAMMPKSQWDISEHDASYYGTRLLKSIFNSNRFTFPTLDFEKAVFYFLAVSIFDKNNNAHSSRKDIRTAIEKLIVYYDQKGQGLVALIYMNIETDIINMTYRCRV